MFYISPLFIGLLTGNIIETCNAFVIKKKQEEKGQMHKTEIGC